MSRKLNQARMVAISTHNLAQAFLDLPDEPARTRMLGRFVIIWPGKPGDVRPTVNSNEFFGDK